MSTKDRPSLTVFADDGIAAMVHELHRRGGATAALIYTYVGRCAPQTHRCGLFQLHLDFLARDVGISREKLDELCPALHPHASFDPDTHVWWVPDLAEQYFPHAENNNHMKSVRHHVARIPDCQLKTQAIQFWSAAPKWHLPDSPQQHERGMARNVMEGGITNGNADGITDGIASSDTKVASLRERGGAS